MHLFGREVTFDNVKEAYYNQAILCYYFIPWIYKKKSGCTTHLLPRPCMCNLYILPLLTHLTPSSSLCNIYILPMCYPLNEELKCLIYTMVCHLILWLRGFV